MARQAGLEFAIWNLVLLSLFLLVNLKRLDIIY